MATTPTRIWNTTTNSTAGSACATPHEARTSFRLGRIGAGQGTWTVARLRFPRRSVLSEYSISPLTIGIRPLGARPSPRQDGRPRDESLGTICAQSSKSVGHSGVPSTPLASVTTPANRPTRQCHRCGSPHPRSSSRAPWSVTSIPRSAMANAIDLRRSPVPWVCGQIDHLGGTAVRCFDGLADRLLGDAPVACRRSGSRRRARPGGA